MNETKPALKIAYIMSRRFPSRETDTQQVIRTVDALASLGVKIDLLIPREYQSLLRGTAAAEQHIRDFYATSHPFGIRFLLGNPPGTWELHRLSHGLIAAFRAAIGSYDLVYTRSLLALGASLLLGKKVIFETYRLLNREAPWMANLLRYFSSWPNFLGVFVHSRMARNSLEEAGLPRQKLAVVYNGYAPSEMEPYLTRADARAILKFDPEQPVVCYTGHLRKNKGLESIIETARLTPEIRYILVGGTPDDRQILEARLTSETLRNVDCLGWYPSSELHRFLYAADILIIPPSARPLTVYGRTVLPMKIFTYLAAGRPIVGPKLPDLEEIFQDGKQARLVEPDNPQATAEALRQILRSPELAEAMSQACLTIRPQFTWQERAKNIVTQIAEWETVKPGENQGD
jgi:glycosyltransferase involved in cell wall biosynthesis